MAHLVLNGVIARPHEKIAIRVIITDGSAMSTFSKKTLAKELFNKAKSSGKDVLYNKKINAVIYKYPGKSKEEIAKKLRLEVLKYGGSFQ